MRERGRCLIDTHILLWLMSEPDRIGKRAADELARAAARGDLAISALSYWEIAMLASKKHVRIAISVLELRSEALVRGIRELPVDGLIAAHAGGLLGMHGDPADRIIIATALHHAMPLATADRRILAWSGPLDTIDARR